MSFLGVKVILFLVIPLIIKEKSNASALSRLSPDFLKAFARFIAWSRATFCLASPDVYPVFC